MSLPYTPDNEYSVIYCILTDLLKKARQSNINYLFYGVVLGDCNWLCGWLRDIYFFFIIDISNEFVSEERLSE